MAIDGKGGGAIAFPTILQCEDIVCGAEEGIGDDGVAGAVEPVHTVGVSVSGVRADSFKVVEADVARAFHLDLPGTAASDAGDVVDLDFGGVVHDDAVPVGLVHPAVVVVGVLRAVVDNDAGAEDVDVVDLPDVERAEHDGAGREVDGVPGGCVDVLNVGAGAEILDVWRVWTGCGRLGRIGEEKEEVGVGEEVVGATDGEFGGARDRESDGASGAGGADVEAPGLDVYAVVPESVGVCGDCDLQVAGGGEVEEIVIEGGVHDRCGLTIDGDGEVG